MPINWKGITTTGNRYYDAKKIAALNDSLQYLPIKQRAAVLGSIIEESGGDPMAKSDNGTYQGLLQWGADRYRIQSNNPQEELARQLETLRNTIDNTEDKKSWTHGGTGSGYNSGKEAYQDFSDSISPLDPTFRAFSFGYVRPKGKEASYSNRLKVAQQVYDRLYEDEQNRNAKYTPSTNFEDYQYKPITNFSQGGTLNTTPWDQLTLAEQAAMMKVAVQNGIYNLHDIRQKYNEFAEGGSKEEEEEVNTDDYSVGNLVDALYQTNPKEEYLGEPSHHYDFTQSEEWADAHGYYPDARGHRDDRVKKPAHPSHPSRGTWDGDKFILTDLGMQTPNYTMFGLIDGGQDPQAILTYKGGVVLPEITVSPQGNYFFNPYDNIELHTKAHGGSIHIKPENRGKFTALKERTGHSATWFKEHGTPAQKKMATFAINARHWNHALGGNLYDGTTQPTQQINVSPNIFRRPNGEYFYQASPDSEEVTVTPQIVLFDDPSLWTYADANGKLYTPRQAAPTTQGEVLQGKEPSTWENIIATSNNNYTHPILGAPARWSASWSNDTNPIKAIWNNPVMYAHPYTMAAKTIESLAGKDGLQKTWNLYQNSDGSDNARWLWQRSLAGDALEALGLIPTAAEGYKAGKTFLQNNYLGAFGKPSVAEGYTTLSPTVRTRLGDVEIDNPSLLYHLDRGNGNGAFSNQGAYIQDGFLYPGTPKDASATSYSWWNLGKPYATSVGEEPLTRMTTTTLDEVPSMLHVRSQNYPIGQWNGKKGFVLNSEYVSPEPVDVWNSTYELTPGYGFRKIEPEYPVISWEEALNSKPYTFNGFKEEPYQMHLKRAKAKGFDTSNIDIIDMRTDSDLRQKVVKYWAKNNNISEEEALKYLTDRLNRNGNAATISGTRMIIYNEDGPQLSAKLSHELEHLLHYPKEAIPDKMLTPRVTRIHGDRYTKLNNTEYSALGSQIHDFYGHTGNEAITPDMLKFARKNYEKETGINNRMTEMLSNHLDLDYLAKWMTRYSSGLAAPITFGTYELYKNN